MHRTRLARRIATQILAISVFVGLLVEIPSAAPAVSVDVPDLAAPGEPPPPVSARDRVPIRAPVEENGVRNPDVVALTADSASSPQETVAGLEQDLSAGGPNVDVFATESGAEHYALVYAQDVNVQDSQGRWVKADTQLVEDAAGWRGELESASVGFPRTLGPDGVSFGIPQGTVVFSPAGETTQSPGARDGGTVTYRDVLPATDFLYFLTAHGYKENVVLKGPRAPGLLSFDVHATGLTLASGAGGQIDVLSGGKPVAVIPTPVAYESSAAVNDSVLTTTLTDKGGGQYRLNLFLDPAFLATATYPVTVDPGSTTLYPQRDTYANQNSPGSSYESSQYLKVGSSYNTYIRFDVDNRIRAERLVYQADLSVWIYSQGNSSEVTRAKRVLDPWPTPITWNNQPSASSTVYGDDGAPTNQWATLPIKSLYQRYLDTTWPDRGARLGSTDTKTFTSDEAGGTARPQLFLSWNDLPRAPHVLSPADGAVVETDSPTLTLDEKVSDIFDFNGDDVLVQYQVSDNATDFTGSHLEWSSPWTNDKRYTVPSGVLTDGQDYWWRVQSWDVCVEPDGMCSLTDGAGWSGTARLRFPGS